ATFPYFLFQYGKVGGVLDLTKSQALCAYLIRKSEVKDVVAVDFGAQAPQAVGGPGEPPNATGPDRGCNYQAIATPGTFLVSDTQVSLSVCIRSFRWLEPVTKDASFLSLNDLSVNKTTFIDLGSNADRHDQTSNQTHKFEAIGLETHSLIFNFAKAASYANW